MLNSLGYSSIKVTKTANQLELYVLDNANASISKEVCKNQVL